MVKSVPSLRDFMEVDTCICSKVSEFSTIVDGLGGEIFDFKSAWRMNPTETTGVLSRDLTLVFKGLFKTLIFEDDILL
jgi:hypothetical protein